MHGNSYDLMQDFVKRYEVENMRVADMGSMDINGNYKLLFKGEYVGIDREMGKNVTLTIGSKEWDEVGLFDTVICGQVLEHCDDVPELMDNITKILKTDGYLCLIVPSDGPPHEPNWVRNYTQDEVEEIIKGSGFEILEIQTTRSIPFNDIRCIARKVEDKQRKVRDRNTP